MWYFIGGMTVVIYIWLLLAYRYESKIAKEFVFQKKEEK